MSYKPYPKSLDTPSRKARKSERNRVFEHNYVMNRIERRKRLLAKEQVENEETA